MSELARIQIRIIFEGNFIPIFKYSYSSLIKDIFEKCSLMLPLNKILYWIFFMRKLCLDLFFSLKIIGKYLNKVLSKNSHVLEFLIIYKLIFEYIRLSKNLQMNNQIYLYWGNGTNTNTNNIQGPFYSNIQIFAHHWCRAVQEMAVQCSEMKNISESGSVVQRSEVYI